MDIDSFYYGLTSQVLNGTFRLRESSGVLHGPSLAVGSCLEPLVQDGDKLWIDRDDTDARDGDLIMVKFSDAAMQRMVNGVKAGAAAGNPLDVQWLAEYGESMSPFAIKLFAAGFAAVAPHVADADTPSLIPLTDRYFDGAVIGIVKRIQRNGVPLYVDRLHAARPRYIDGTPLAPIAPGGNLVTDPTFNRRAALWEIQASDNSRFTYHWGTNKPDESEIVAGAGVAGDNALRLHEHDGVSTGIVRSIGRPGMSSFVNGQTVQIAVRVRKRDSGTLAFGALEFRVAVMAQDSSTATDDTGVLFTVGDINGWTVDVWQQAIAQVTVSEDFLSGEPFIGLDIFWDFDDGTVPMRVDVDMANMIVIATP
jgi:hypothetical protein